jgi:hypothetical protein
MQETNFTAVYDYAAADLDLGEAGLVNDALEQFFSNAVYNDGGVEKTIDRVTSMQTKINVKNNRIEVIVYGTANIGA